MYNLNPAKLLKSAKAKILKKTVTVKGATQLPHEEDIDDHEKLYEELRNSRGDRQTSMCVNTEDFCSVRIVLADSNTKYIVPIEYFKSTLDGKLMADCLYTRSGEGESAAIKVLEMNVNKLMEILPAPQ